MTTQEMLSNICQRMDALATKDDIVKIQNDIQALRRTVSENFEVLEGRVFEVEAKNDQLQKEISALKKENQTMKDTLNLQDRKKVHGEGAEQPPAVFQTLEPACLQGSRAREGDQR